MGSLTAERIAELRRVWVDASGPSPGETADIRDLFAALPAIFDHLSASDALLREAAPFVGWTGAPQGLVERLRAHLGAGETVGTPTMCQTLDADRNRCDLRNGHGPGMPARPNGGHMHIVNREWVDLIPATPGVSDGGGCECPPGFSPVQVFGDGYTLSMGPGFTTVRSCIDCGVLMAGGPTRCLPCAGKAAPAPSGGAKACILCGGRGIPQSAIDEPPSAPPCRLCNGTGRRP